jgi:magnesium-protoporphyrin O-methyltransferase
VAGCCNPRGCDEFFNPRFARRSAERYRERGLDRTGRRIVAFLESTGLDGATVLEVGGGVGEIQLELLKRGAARTTNLELSGAYEEEAARLAREAGVDGRIQRRLHDIAVDPTQVEPADIVVLNRVVCCSPDGVRLAAVAARLAQRTLLLSFPRDRVVGRIVARMMNATFRLIGRSFRVFLHPRASLYAAAQAEGLWLAKTGRSIAWEFAALHRAP